MRKLKASHFISDIFLLSDFLLQLCLDLEWDTTFHYMVANPVDISYWKT